MVSRIETKVGIRGKRLQRTSASDSRFCSATASRTKVKRNKRVSPRSQESCRDIAFRPANRCHLSRHALKDRKGSVTHTNVTVVLRKAKLVVHDA